jgi:beta-galactosidase
VVYLAFHDQGVKPDYARGRWSFPPLSGHLNIDHFDRRNVTAAVFTNCDEVELRINGKKIGSRRPADFRNGIIEWALEYKTGEIKTVGYRKGKEVCSHILKTAGEPEKISLTADRPALAPGEIAHIEVNITDKNGILCPNAEVLVEFALTGDGEILGACSPDLNAALGYTLPKAVTSGGKALVMVKAGNGPGVLELTAYSGGIKPAVLRVR